ncbi:Plant UBX domain-containing protein 8 [Linum grandiflorum]
MATPDQEAINTFISITGATESVAVQRLQEHSGDLNAAVNAHFTEGDRSSLNPPSVPPLEDDIMDIDDPIETAPLRNPLSLLSDPAVVNPFSLLDPQFRRSFFEGGSDFGNRGPFVTQPRQVRQIPIEVKDSPDASGRSGHGPVIEDVTGTDYARESGIPGTVILSDDEDNGLNTTAAQRDEQDVDVLGDTSNDMLRPSAPLPDSSLEYGNDIEEEMVRAAIEASKREAAELAEEEQALREIRGKVGVSEVGASEPENVIPASNGRLEKGGSFIQDEVEDVEEQPLVRHRSRNASSSSMESAKDVVTESDLPSSPINNNPDNQTQTNGNAFPEEWGGISSEEHDEAVMLEAAMFGGVPEASGYQFPYAPHQFMQRETPYPRPAPRPLSPSLEAQRLIREQQDDEYLASLAADREKEMKALEEVEARRLQEAAAREAALEEAKLKEEESRRKLEEAQEIERQLAAKEASLPQEPTPDEENAVTLLVRMPDGTRHGRRFLKSDRLQSLFDFIDVTRVVKPGTYRLVRPYPRQAFSDGHTALTLTELGLTSKQEALFLELI